MVTRVTGQVGALAAATDTVQAIPAVSTGGHWLRCLLGSLVKSGDVSGALGSVARFTDPVQRGFHTRVSVALQTMEGDVSGARDPVEMISPEEGHRDRALSIIAQAKVRRGENSPLHLEQRGTQPLWVPGPRCRHDHRGSGKNAGCRGSAEKFFSHGS